MCACRIPSDRCMSHDARAQDCTLHMRGRSARRVCEFSSPWPCWPRGETAAQDRRRVTSLNTIHMKPRHFENQNHVRDRCPLMSLADTCMSTYNDPTSESCACAVRTVRKCGASLRIQSVQRTLWPESIPIAAKPAARGPSGCTLSCSRSS